MTRDDNPNRRKFLQGTGIAMGGLALGVPGVAAKPHNDDGWTHATGREVNQILEEREVSILLDELGNPPLQRGRGQKTTVERGASRITRIVVPSHVGTLLSSKSDNGVNGALFIFGTPTKKNGRVPPGFLKRLPSEYRDLPAAGEGVLIVGPNGEPVLFGANGESAAAVPEQETLVDNEGVRIVKSTYQGETALIREFKRGSKAGTIQATEPLSDAELSSVESEMSRVSAQGISASDVSTADIEMPPGFNDVVERYELFEERLGECDVNVDELEGYVNKYLGARFELTKPADLFSKRVLTGVVSYLLSQGIAAVLGSSIVASLSTPIAIIAAAAVGTLIALGTGTEYTVGVYDEDANVPFLGMFPLFAGAVANEYRVPLSDTQFAGETPGHFDPDYIPPPI